MSDSSQTPSPRDALRRELEDTRSAYHALLAEIPDGAWERPSANPAWTVRQMMFHITLALRFLPADIAALRRGFTPTVPPGLFNRINEWYTRFAGSRQTRRSLAAEYDRRHQRLLTLLDSIEPHEWSLSARYPDINRNLQGTQTIAAMFHYIAVHFAEHAADIRPALAGASPSAARPRSLGPLTRFLFRAPLVLHRLGLGWLLGGRFLLLNHTGRKSGLPRQVLLEVTAHDRHTDTYTVASGFGRGSQWFKNIQAHPRVTIQVGPRRLLSDAEILSPQQSAAQMAAYARRHPTAARALTRVLGLEADGDEQTYREIARQHIPFVTFHPVQILRQTPTPREQAALATLLLLTLTTVLLVLSLRKK